MTDDEKQQQKRMIIRMTIRHLKYAGAQYDLQAGLAQQHGGKPEVVKSFLLEGQQVRQLVEQMQRLL